MSANRWTVSAPKEWQYVEVDGAGFVVGTFEGEHEDERGRITVIPAADCVQVGDVWLDTSAFSTKFVDALNAALEADWRADAKAERDEVTA